MGTVRETSSAGTPKCAGEMRGIMISAETLKSASKEAAVNALKANEKQNWRRV